MLEGETGEMITGMEIFSPKGNLRALSNTSLILESLNIYHLIPGDETTVKNLYFHNFDSHASALEQKLTGWLGINLPLENGYTAGRPRGWKT